MQKDLTFGNDIRGDYALFIEKKHFINGGEAVDEETKKAAGSDMVFFRVIENGIEQRGHGWLENGKIFQWG